MKTMLVNLLLVCLYSTAQEVSPTGNDTAGVKWENGISWNDIIKKAKNENKYIFVDCYTTWCGPCKRMDEEVYVKDSVGNFMNAKFINVRVQMDRTNKDAQMVQDWYVAADVMRKQYKVTAFPSYLFFNSDGQIVHRDVAYIAPDKFVEVASKAFDTKSQYYTLKAEYISGKKNYSIVRYLISKGRQFNDQDFVQQVQSDYLKYLSKQPKSVVYTKDNIEFIASVIPNTKTKWSRIFYRDGKKVNRLMEQSGFVRRAIDSAIAREYINPIFSRLQKDETPDWSKMYNEIETRFGKDTASRNITWRKVKWYRKNSDKENYKKCFIELYEMGGLDTSFYKSDFEINYFAFFEVLQWGSEAKELNLQLLNIAINMMEGVIRRADIVINVSNGDHEKDIAFTKYWKASKIDTYASLLYRAGMREEAIRWEKEAFIISTSIGDEASSKSYKSNIEAMVNKSF
jgi:thioredoxin-related protein